MTNGLRVAHQNTIRRLEQEAAARAAAVEYPSSEHDFYFGVITAARDHLHAGDRDVRGERWLSGQTPEFKEGYLKTCTLIGVAADHSLQRLPLPAFD